MSWEPEEELVAWAEEHFKTLSVGAVWSPDSSGVTYIKQDDDTFALVRMVDHPTAKEHHAKFSILFDAVGLKVIEGDGEIVVPPAMTPQENAVQEYEHKQNIAQGWQCSCEYPLANFELENKEVRFVEDREVLLSDGETQNIEVWAIEIACPNCENVIDMDPDDYNLLAGDADFMKWTNSVGTSFIALTRNQIVEIAEAGDVGVAVGKVCPDTGEKVPPWIWGTYCLRHFPNAIDDMSEEEHEEFKKSEEEGADEQQRLIDDPEYTSLEEE